MNIVVVGTGYVGLTQGACLAHLGHSVTCVDILEDRVRDLQDGKIHIHEEQLPELVEEGRASGRLRFTTNAQEAASGKPAVVFICVQTPRGDDGSCDLAFLETAMRTWGSLVNPSTLVVVKSTVPPGIRDDMHAWLGDPRIQIASNPEFLRQGTSVSDFLHPDRIVFGVESKAAEQVLRNVHKGIEAPVIVTTVETAQLIKYASNAMLATRLSFMNEIAKIADVLGADIKEIERGVGLDPRIGSKFLRSSAGFGGGCLPKDTSALQSMGESMGTAPHVFKGVLATNDEQPEWLLKKVQDRLGTVSGKRLAVWGLSFNGGTDDVRHSPAMMLVERLRDLGADIVAHDPHAMPKARQVLGDSVMFVDTISEAAHKADALLVLTEWKEFLDAPWGVIRDLLKEPIVFDGKHFLPHNELHEIGFEVIGIGLCPGGHAR